MILHHSRREGNIFHTGPITWRSLRTRIKLDNVIINLSENVEYDQLYTNASNDFIVFLYELLLQ